MSEPPARFLDEPQDPDLAALYRLWATKRGLRLMPSKADFDPAEFKTLLSAVVLMEAGPPGGPYIVRLVGEGIVDFFGRTTKGQPAGSLMRPEGYRAFMLLLDSVVNSRAPVVRAGRTYWSADKPHKRFEALFLPLSNDDTVVKHDPRRNEIRLRRSLRRPSAVAAITDFRVSAQESNSCLNEKCRKHQNRRVIARSAQRDEAISIGHRTCA